MKLSKGGVSWADFCCDFFVNGGKTTILCSLGLVHRELVFLDTCSPISILSAQAHQLLWPTLKSLNVRAENVHTACGIISGEKFRVPLVFIDDDVPLPAVEITVVVPDDPRTWDNRPTLLGYSDCLDRIRFAFEPALTASDRNLFFFGRPGATFFE